MAKLFGRIGAFLRGPPRGVTVAPRPASSPAPRPVETSSLPPLQAVVPVAPLPLSTFREPSVPREPSVAREPAVPPEPQYPRPIAKLL